VLIDVEVQVSTGRPLRTDAVVFVRLEQEIPEHMSEDAGFFWARCEAEVTAAHMVMCHPFVEMVLGTRTVDVLEI
jgi:hypothetical protein